MVQSKVGPKAVRIPSGKDDNSSIAEPGPSEGVGVWKVSNGYPFEVSDSGA